MQSKKRFIHEAQAALGLQHNSICVVHDIDETSEAVMLSERDTRGRR
jgi:hypothetical protein